MRYLIPNPLTLACLVGTSVVALLGTGAAAEVSQQDKLDHFEKHIRPALVEHCYKCHSADAQKEGKLKGSLLLDSKEGLLHGGDTGPSLVPGNPKESLLMKAIRWEDPDIEMPPKKQMPPEVIAEFEKWIAMGAEDPRSGGTGKAKREIDIAAGRQHWSFQPIAAAKVPSVQNNARPRTDLDRFIVAAQEAAGVTPAPAADRRTLIRRAHFDLIGLPPKPEEVEAFIADQTPDAFPRLVDRLLQSPQYGERWGRHWLDVVRYAESGGYEFDGYRDGAYFYRDWVIQALNQDMPYDAFVRHQFAGDLLDSDKIRGASAMGFLVAGPYPGQITAKTKERIRYDQLDDMLATTGGAMLGLTIGCVRCHDHKYDPIPQVDYYNLAATLANTEHGEIKVERETPETKRVKAEYDNKLKQLGEGYTRFQKEVFPARFSEWRAKAEPQTAEQSAPWQVLDVDSINTEQTHLRIESDGVVTYLNHKAKDDIYTIKVRTIQKGIRAFRLDALSDPKLPSKGPGLSDNGNFVLGDVKITAKALDPALKAKPVNLTLKALKASFEQKGYPLSNAVDNSPNSGWAVDTMQGKDHAAMFGVEGEPVGFEGGTEFEISLRFSGYFGLGRLRLAFSNEEAAPELEAAAQPQALKELLAAPADTATLQATVSDALARWFVRYDKDAASAVAPSVDQLRNPPYREYVKVYSTKTGGADVFLLRRGEVDNKGGKAEPGFIQVLMKGEPSKWTKPSDEKAPAVHPRIALGRWMTDPENGAGHLLARVMVNRMWHHHFGRGLVATPNDFGLQGEKPTNPELLDYLAGEFIRSGWSLKHMHRLMMASAVYQQAANPSEANRRTDPENKLLWQRTPTRLEAEAIRDSMLQVAGTLDLKQFGPSESQLENPRRSVYLRVRRSELFPFLTLFDAPEALQSTGERGLTTVPTQALTLLNSPFVRSSAAKLSERILVAKDITPEAAVSKAFEIALSRKPTQAESTKFGEFIQAQLAADSNPKALQKAVTQTCLVLLCMNEFVYID